jgi:CheY-like chemotaxis protein
VPPRRPPTLRQIPAAANYEGTVLYVEDNLSNVRLLERIVRTRPGVTLRHAIDGATALKMLDEERPDLVLLDLHLADMSGEEVLRRIWTRQDGQRIPVAVLSADATVHSKRALMASGAIGYLTKPLDVAELLQLLDHVVGGRP